MTKKSSFFKNNWFILTMLLGIIGGCITGWLWPGATALEPLGTIFVNMMFCVVVPMVFCSISSAIANMGTVKRAGKLLGTTILTFVFTTTVASVLMYIVLRFVPLTVGSYIEGEVEAGLSVADLVVNFFTKPDFVELWSRKAILPLIIAAVIFGFGVQMAGGKETATAKLLADITNCIMKTVKIITYYAPIGFFGFFAYLVATYGPELMGDYGRTILIYYVVAFLYMLLSSPVYAYIGGGKGAAKVMFKHLFKPAAVAFGTCSSVASIPTNIEAAQDSGVSKEVSEIVMPLGATMNMDGSGMSAILKVAFLFALFGLDFSGGRAFLAILVAVFSSIAMSGIPGGGGTGELVLCTIFFPDQLAIAYPMAIALGNLIDPPATMVNSAGDYVSSFIVSRFADGKDWLQKQLHRNEK